MKKRIMIRYAEMSTKKDNLMFFIDCLEKNIKEILIGFKVGIIKTKSRIYIDYKEKDQNNIILLLKKVPGIIGFSVAYLVETDIEKIKEMIIDIMNNYSFNSFKVVTKRSFKSFEYDSIEINKMMGEHVLNNFNVKVDVHTPDIIINIEIRDRVTTYIYLNEGKGLGGYPIGSNGKGLLMLSGGIDSPVAGFLSLKRGMQIDAIYFESPPHTSLNAKNKVIELSKILNEYSKDINLYVIPFSNIQEHIYKHVDRDYSITIMRRMMYRISEKLANNLNIKVLINGESLGQVSSQTVSNLYVINNVTCMPIIRPLICLDKLEIIELSKKIGTYETSILPFEDCCTVFVPEHPVLEPSLEKCEYFESQFDYNILIEECLNKVEKIKVSDYDRFEKLL